MLNDITIRHIIIAAEFYSMIFFYTSLLWLLLPYIFLRLVWRARKQPEYLHHIGERFGCYPVQSDKPVIWLHAVSVGETRSIQTLVSGLNANYPDHQILITHTTPTGRAAGEQLYGPSVLRVYLPYDYPFAVSRFLKHFRPQIGILMETEIWFNLIDACHEFGIPLLLLNARLSEKSARGYGHFSRLSKNTLEKFTVIAAQTENDAARISSLGAKNVTVMGNLKFDITPPPAMLELGQRLREQFGKSRRVFVAASTREGEEVLLLDALRNFQIADLLLVIVPRHPQRFAAVAGLLEQQHVSFQRRSEIWQMGAPHSNNPRCQSVSPETRVVLGDSMGEMFAYYAAADLAFIGGSLLPFGGQNLIEACSVGVPVLVGPYMYNFEEATRLAVSAGAAIQASAVPGLIKETQRLFSDNAKLSDMRYQGMEFVRSNQGATEISLQIIRRCFATTTHPDSLPPARSSL